jgi:hypothetical protein
MYMHNNHCHRVTAHLQLNTLLLYHHHYFHLSLCKPRRHTVSTSTSHLHSSLNIEPIRYFIHQLTAKFFAHCPSHPKPLVQQIGNYSLADLTNLYKKHTHNRTKHILP